VGGNSRGQHAGRKRGKSGRDRGASWPHTSEERHSRPPRPSAERTRSASCSAASRLLSSRSASAASASSPLLAPPATSSSCAAMREAAAPSALGAGGDEGGAPRGEPRGVAPPAGLLPGEAAAPLAAGASSRVDANAGTAARAAAPASTACRRRTSWDCSRCSCWVVALNSFRVCVRPAQ
jgi:hypothetical protein